ncbi:MAG TPA: proline dehydrogenase family protein [Candidatus Limnocylindria bacterium]|nr:proline dehydrogenase family protein [Candidatus Limnocylindria bacterium]
MRTVLLWMADNGWLRRNLPRLPFARRAVRRFMPGETIEEALEAAELFRPHGIAVLMTRLGENLADVGEAEAVVEHYHRVLDMLRARGLDGEVSLKLTQVGLDLDAGVTYQHVASLAAHAAQGGTTLWIDMESSGYVDRSLELYRRLKVDHHNVGICLQSYLRRTPADLHALLPLRPHIRLVKGAYHEPERVAFHRKVEVDAAFQALAVTMLPHLADGRLRLGLGTHDTALIERIAGHARAAGVAVDAFEVQMLYGVRMDEQRRLAAEGYAVRDLISYGEAWYAWYMRRLAERPANIVFALRQLLG